MNDFWQQIGVLLAVSAATAYLTVCVWRRAAGLRRTGHGSGCGGCAKCPSSTPPSGPSNEADAPLGKSLPLVNIDLSSTPDAARRSR